MMVLFQLFLVALAAYSCVEAAQPDPPAPCTEFLERKPWHLLSNNEKTDYLNAELCFMKIPASHGLPTALTLFDEFQEAHQTLVSSIHFVGAFLPFHRFFMWAHEYILRTQCGYKGAQPYWYEQMDAGHFINSSVLDPVYGFGGNGNGSDGCITDGPFASYVNVIGPGANNTKHCISRAIDEKMSAGAAQANIDACYKGDTFATAWPCIESTPHSAGHGGIGGEMLDVMTSPGDPIFYLHHTWLDKVWWDWQAKNLSSRLYDISGNNMQSNSSFSGGNGTFPGGNGTFPGGFPGGTSPGNGSVPTGFPGGGFPLSNATVIQPDGDPGNVTTLTHVLHLYQIIPNATINDVMDIRAGQMCYKYIDP